MFAADAVRGSLPNIVTRAENKMAVSLEECQKLTN